MNIYIRLLIGMGLPCAVLISFYFLYRTLPGSWIPRILKRHFGVRWSIGTMGTPTLLKIWYLTPDRGMEWMDYQALAGLLEIDRKLDNPFKRHAPSCWIAEVETKEQDRSQYFMHATPWKPTVFFHHGNERVTIYDAAGRELVLDGASTPMFLMEAILRVVPFFLSADQYKLDEFAKVVEKALQDTKGISKSPAYEQIRIFVGKARQQFNLTHKPVLDLKLGQSTKAS